MRAWAIESAAGQPAKPSVRCAGSRLGVDPVDVQAARFHRTLRESWYQVLILGVGRSVNAGDKPRPTC